MSMLESMLDGFVVMDRDWVYQYVNPQAERLLKSRREELYGRTVWECFPPLVDTEIGRRLREAMDGQVLTQTEEFFEPLGMWLEVRGAPSPNGLNVYFRDVTERRQQQVALLVAYDARRESETALRRSEERYRALTDHCSDLVTVLAPNGTILYDSPSVASLLGYRADERLGQSVLAHLHPDEVLSLRSLWRRQIRAQQGQVRATHRLRHADGSWRWAESVGSLQIDNPAVEGIVINTRDITERREMEEQLIQAGKLAALGGLVSGVAHEINNPLSAISGHAQLLQLHGDPEVRKDGAVIQEMVHRMSRLIRSLRTFAPAARGTEERREADLNAVVHSALDVVRGRLNAHGIRLTLTLAESLPPVPINESEIEQVIVNLLVNAEQAVRNSPPDSRRVHLSTAFRPSAHGAKTSRPICRLTVTDSGGGIAPEILPRIFEPFFTTKEVGEGTGLGLSICHNIVRSHGGTLTARTSRSGNGAICAVDLPV